MEADRGRSWACYEQSFCDAMSLQLGEKLPGMHILFAYSVVYWYI